MNTKYTTKILTILFVGWAGLSFAQSGTATYKKKLVSLKTEKTTVTASEKTAKFTGYAYTKKIPAFYSGYVIELTTSDVPLTRDYEAFKSFGKIYHNKTDEGYYSYFILADCNKRESVEEYVNNIVLHRVPQAKIIDYKNGQQKEKIAKKKRKFYMVD